MQCQNNQNTEKLKLNNLSLNAARHYSCLSYSALVCAMNPAFVCNI